MLEVLHRVGDENLAARNSSIRQRAVEHPPGRADERLAREVFLIAWLLAHQHDVRGLAPLPRHRLCRVLVKRAARAFVLGFGKLRQRVDPRRKLEIELPLVWHRALLAGPRAVNARRRRQFDRAPFCLA